MKQNSRKQRDAIIKKKNNNNQINFKTYELKEVLNK